MTSQKGFVVRYQKTAFLRFGIQIQINLHVSIVAAVKSFLLNVVVFDFIW